MKRWPSFTFHAVPPSRMEDDLAREVRLASLPHEPETALCELSSVCARGGFVTQLTKFSPGSNGHEALLVPEPGGGFLIIVDPTGGRVVHETTQRHRTRFRIAHEIGHSFFYDRQRTPARRVAAWSASEERFCDAFASALLVPRPAVNLMPPAPQSVLELRKRYDVSTEVAGRALARAYPEHAILGLLHGPNPRTRREPGWRITWSAGSLFVPRNARIRADEIISTAIASGYGEGVKSLSLGGLKGRFVIAAARNPNDSQVVVVCAKC